MFVNSNSNSNSNSSRVEIITEKGNASNKESYEIFLIKNTPNSFTVAESLNNKSINTQEEPIYLDMRGNNNIGDEYHDYMDLDGSDESEIECQFEMKINKNKEKPSCHL